MRYQLTARGFQGPTWAPLRDETVSMESDNLEELNKELPGLADGKFDVWIYERKGAISPVGRCALVVIARYDRKGNTVKLDR